MPGRYTLNIYATVNGVVADWVTAAAVIDVAEGDYFGTGRLPSTRYGSVVVDQRWTVEIRVSPWETRSKVSRLRGSQCPSNRGVARARPTRTRWRRARRCGLIAARNSSQLVANLQPSDGALLSDQTLATYLGGLELWETRTLELRRSLELLFKLVSDLPARIRDRVRKRS